MSTSDQEPKPKFIERVWPGSAWKAWHANTPKGLKRYDVLAYSATLPPLILVEYGYWAALAAKAVTVPITVAAWAGPFVWAFALSTILAKKKKESLDAQVKRDYRAGIGDAYEQWRNSAGLLHGSLRRTHRHVEHLVLHRQTNAGARTAALEQHLQVIALIVRSVFGDEVCGKQICVSLALLDPADTKVLVTVKFQAELPDRLPGRRLSLVAGKPGSVAAFISKRPQYVPDTQAKAVRKQFEDRPYRSLMSWPVLHGTSGNAIGVVNVDSELPNGFDALSSPTRRKQVEWMCQPVLQGIAICLIEIPTQA